MKKIIAIALALMILAAAPAFAALKILPEDVQARLHALALEVYPGHQVHESWLHEFHATSREVFVVILSKDHEDKVVVYVDVADEVVVGEEEYEAIIAAEGAAQEEDPVFSITSVGLDKTDEEASITSNDDGKGNGIWVAGGMVMLALAGGVALYSKKK